MHTLEQTLEPAAWNYAGGAHLEPKIEFDYDEVDRLLGEAKTLPADARAEAADFLSIFFAWVFSARKNNGIIRPAMVRFAAACAGIRPDLVSENGTFCTFEDLGKELSISKAAMCKVAVLFEETFNFQTARGRKDEARLNMRNARLKQLCETGRVNKSENQVLIVKRLDGTKFTLKVDGQISALADGRISVNGCAVPASALAAGSPAPSPASPASEPTAAEAP